MGRGSRRTGLGLMLALAAVVLALTPVTRAAEPFAPDEQADDIELAFDADGTLHLLAHVTTNGLPNELVYRNLPPGGAWSAGENLASGFAIAGPGMELVRHPDGSTCLFFDGWREATDVSTEGLFLTCRRGGAWESPTQVDGNRGVTATFDGAFDAGGTAHALYAVRGQIAFGDVDLGAVGVDAGWPSLAIDGDGTLHAVWAAFGNPFGVFTSRSSDGGATWTEPESLTGVAQADVPVDVISDGVGTVHLLIPGNPSIYRTWSNGAWSPITELPTGIGPKRLAIGADGVPHVAWASQEAVFALDASSGAWSTPVIVDNVATPPSPLAIAVSDTGEVATAWVNADGITATAIAGVAESFADSVPSPFDINLDPVVVAQSAALAAGVVLLVPLPAQIFNNTIEANYESISGALARWRRRLRLGRDRADSGGTFWRRPIGVATFFLAAAVISAFLDPSLSMTVESALTVVGLLVGLVFVAVGFALPNVLLHRIRSRAGARIEVLPLALPVAVASVAISRLTGFEPGYLYGLLAGVTLLGTVKPGDAPRGVLLTSTWMLVVVVAAWFGLVPVREASTGASPPIWAIPAEAALATIVVSGLESLLFNLLPMSFAPGAVLFSTRRRAWAVLFGLSALAFFHVIVNPANGYLVDSSRVPLVTTLGLFGLFAAVTALTWAYFRFRPRGAAPPPSAA